MKSQSDVHFFLGGNFKSTFPDNGFLTKYTSTHRIFSSNPLGGLDVSLLTLVAKHAQMKEEMADYSVYGLGHDSKDLIPDLTPSTFRILTRKWNSPICVAHAYADAERHVKNIEPGITNQHIRKKKVHFWFLPAPETEPVLQLSLPKSCHTINYVNKLKEKTT